MQSPSSNLGNALLGEVDVANTLSALLKQEDTDNNGKITLDDEGPKSFTLVCSVSTDRHTVRGTYALSTLLQELTLAKIAGKKTMEVYSRTLYEDPVARLSRRIPEFWVSLTRRLDASSIARSAKDPKDPTSDCLRIYVPASAPEQYVYYQKVAADAPELKLEVNLIDIPAVDANGFKKLNQKPGVLALDMTDQNGSPRGVDFVVPGGRFNEQYYWDSYFCALGLLDCGRVDLAKSSIQNWCFQIQHYGAVLNANRSYYIWRSQPPFLTDLALRIYDATKHELDAKEFLRRVICAAIKEYHRVWMSEPRFDPETGLSRYRPKGLGIPPECPDGHFDHILEPLAKKHNMGLDEFTKAYEEGRLEVPELDDYLLHDRAVRESGHDVSYRVEGTAADLATIDLNCLLYKYECDIAWAIANVFDDRMEAHKDFAIQAGNSSSSASSGIFTSDTWLSAAEQRKSKIQKFLWSEEKGMFCDYNTRTHKQSRFESVTTFYALWSGIATQEQAQSLVAKALPKFEYPGGLVPTTKECCATDGVARQWDFPFGWPPHQMLAWDGLRRYGFMDEAQRLAYRWLYMVTRIAAEYNGVVVEKYNVTTFENSHQVFADYGNQGLEFYGVAQEGFGWTNASYLYGLTIIDDAMKNALSRLLPYEKRHQDGVAELLKVKDAGSKLV